GFYRTFVRPKGSAGLQACGHDAPARDPYFLPADTPDQLAQGERIMRIFMETGAAVTAEDLRTAPDYVRQSIGRLGLPGYIIQRWHRRWHEPFAPFIPPSEWRPNAVATTGTHDTETLAEWWDALGPDDRRQVAGTDNAFNTDSTFN